MKALEQRVKDLELELKGRFNDLENIVVAMVDQRIGDVERELRGEFKALEEETGRVINCPRLATLEGLMAEWEGNIRDRSMFGDAVNLRLAKLEEAVQKQADDQAGISDEFKRFGRDVLGWIEATGT